MHGYDKNNQLIEESIDGEDFARKIIDLSRIRSISEQYLLVSTIDGREMYWEYKGSMDDLKEKLLQHNVLIEA